MTPKVEWECYKIDFTEYDDPWVARFKEYKVVAVVSFGELEFTEYTTFLIEDGETKRSINWRLTNAIARVRDAVCARIGAFVLGFSW